MKTLVRAPNWVGDAVMAIPALEAIRSCRPGAEIVILARPAAAETYRDQPFADRFIEFDYQGRHRGWLGRARLIDELRREKFTVAILLQNAFEAAWLAWRARIPERVGYARDGRGALLTKAIQVPTAGEIPRHESHYYLELLHRAGWIESRGDVEPIRLRVSDSAREATEAKLSAAGSRRGAWRCAIAPGASYGAAKCWLPERFAGLADRLISECGADVILFGTSGEKEIAERICSVMKGRAISLVGQTTMRDLPALLSACSVFVGNDSGAMHVAAAVGLPVVGIFGPTDSVATRPVTRDLTVIREPVSCSPCFLRRCPVDHRCMARIEVGSVFSAVLQTRGRAGQVQLWSRQNA
jgi:heptosyltransferase-2